MCPFHSPAVEDGGSSRTRTCEAVKRVVYSHVELPLSDTPESQDKKSNRGLPLDEVSDSINAWQKITPRVERSAC